MRSRTPNTGTDGGNRKLKAMLSRSKYLKSKNVKIELLKFPYRNLSTDEGIVRIVRSMNNRGGPSGVDMNVNFVKGIYFCKTSEGTSEYSLNQLLMAIHDAVESDY